MKMVDKLEKNHHKGVYYRFRTFLMATVLIASSVVAIGVPTYIATHHKSSNQTKAAEENETLEDKNNDDEIIDGSSLSSY